MISQIRWVYSIATVTAPARPLHLLPLYGRSVADGNILHALEAIPIFGGSPLQLPFQYIATASTRSSPSSEV
jgi:hypothetical protein